MGEAKLLGSPAPKGVSPRFQFGKVEKPVFPEEDHEVQASSSRFLWTIWGSGLCVERGRHATNALELVRVSPVRYTMDNKRCPIPSPCYCNDIPPRLNIRASEPSLGQIHLELALALHAGNIKEGDEYFYYYRRVTL